MAKKQTRRSISVSRTTYERLKAFCESNNISMSQLVETRVNDFLGEGGERPASTPAPRPAPSPSLSAPRPAPALASSAPTSGSSHASTSAHAGSVAAHAHVAAAASKPAAIFSQPASAPEPRPAPQQVPMTSAAARFAVEPPPPIIKPRQETAAPKPAEKRPDQIFTF